MIADPHQDAHVLVVDRDGTKLAVAVRPSLSLMEVLKHEVGLDIDAVCGGHAICGTCHVYVDESHASLLADPDELELEMLEQLTFTTDRSRLACQIPCDERLAGIVLELAPKE